MAPAATSSEARVTAGNLETFREVDGPDAAGAARAFLDGVELFERGATGFVDHDVLAGLHRLDGQRGALGGHRGDQDHVDVGIVEDAAAVVDAFEFWEYLAEFGLGDGLPVGPPFCAGAAGGFHMAEHSEDVAVVDAEHAEFGAVLGHGCSFRERRAHRCGRRSQARRSGGGRSAPRARSRAAGGRREGRR